jgi:hypothetical protein
MRWSMTTATKDQIQDFIDMYAGLVALAEEKLSDLREARRAKYPTYRTGDYALKGLDEVTQDGTSWLYEVYCMGEVEENWMFIPWEEA